MKIAAKQIEPFLKNPDEKFVAILIYGPDKGLVRERAKTASLTIVEDLQDPFNVADIAIDNLTENPSQISDELGSISMMGDRRLIRIRDASDKITESLQDALENIEKTDNVAVIEAGDLKASSKLRKLCEKSDRIAVVPCYAEDARDLGRIIMQKLKEEGITINSDAMQNLTQKITGDRALAMQTIEKIITYIGKDKKEITIDDVMICTEDSSILFVNDLIKASLSGNIEQSGDLLERLLQEGFPAVTICRSFQSYLNRIALVKAHISNGDQAKPAMMKAKPPVFFKEQQTFMQHVNKLSIPVINKLLEQLMETEAELKTTNAPSKTLCDRIVFRIAYMSAKK